MVVSDCGHAAQRGRRDLDAALERRPRGAITGAFSGSGGDYSGIGCVHGRGLRGDLFKRASRAREHLGLPDLRVHRCHAGERICSSRAGGHRVPWICAGSGDSGVDQFAGNEHPFDLHAA